MDKHLQEELLNDRKNIEQLFGQKVSGMAYPYGANSDRVVSKLDEYGFKYARTVEPSYSFDIQKDLLRFKPTCHHDDDRLFELAEQIYFMEQTQRFCFKAKRLFHNYIIYIIRRLVNELSLKHPPAFL